jgi:molybdopterin-containing oxidoreductase family iron-sulfur binding subunit
VGKAYWRSLDELAETPEFNDLVAREFPGLAEEIADPATRRDFLKILGASLGLVGLTSCRWPKELILPFASQPEGHVPGVPQQYATAFELGGAAAGLLVTSFDGRPTKIEGNPLHPGSLGAASALAQAAVLELYDPERSQHPVRREGGREIAQTWDDFAAFSRAQFAGLRARRGAGLAVLAEESSSPSMARLRARFAEVFPQASWHEYEPLSRDNEREGTRSAFGKALRPVYRFAEAEVVVCLDADPLHGHPDALRHAREFAGRRRGEKGKASRLFVAECVPSLTGAAADHRLPVSPSEGATVAAAMAAGLAAAGVALPDSLHPLAGSAVPTGASRFVSAAVQSLAAARGRGLLVAGERHDAAVHALVAALNAALGNVGHTVDYVDASGEQRGPHAETIVELAAALEAGRVDTLVILGGNPAYNAPADLAFAGKLGRARTSIHLSLFDDETSRRCTWHVPRAHVLETWGDTRGWDGTVSVQQPLIEALYGGKSTIELLAAALDDAPSSGYEIVRETFRGLAKAVDIETTWRRTLHDGVLAGSAWPSVEPAPAFADLAAAAARLAAGRPAEGLTAVFIADASVHDGRFANNAWLQELPDPLTKIAWDNAACVGPETAARLGVGHGDVVRLDVGGRSLEIAAYVLPGMAPDTVALPLGYGRTAAGRVGTGVGFDTYTVRTAGSPWIAFGARVAKTGRTYLLATTQDHHAIDLIGLREREHRIGELVREVELDELERDPQAVRKEAGDIAALPLFTELDYKGEHQWGMSIDLSACIGCHACTIACQAENNIAVVGKAQVAKGREMHWIRVDRYFSGKPEMPKIVFQPVACQHCEMAPCESVCPVAATVHSDEGLNQMVYNRCVGTRYCSNNCPFKVRRFNYLNYFKKLPQVEKMVFNPEVTIRSRGVMEKCTFCVQRIEAVKIAAKNDRRPIADGEITPACAQTCPTEAIVFGDLKDPGSRVSKLHRNERAYGLLAELNVQPRTRYLAKLRNPAHGVEEA